MIGERDAGGRGMRTAAPPRSNATASDHGGLRGERCGSGRRDRREAFAEGIAGA